MLTRPRKSIAKAAYVARQLVGLRLLQQLQMQVSLLQGRQAAARLPPPEWMRMIKDRKSKTLPMKRACSRRIVSFPSKGPCQCKKLELLGKSKVAEDEKYTKERQALTDQSESKTHR